MSLGYFREANTKPLWRNILSLRGRGFQQNLQKMRSQSKITEQMRKQQTMNESHPAQ